jgi:hypothetical protein
MTFAGRVEALITIPTGGLSISATNSVGGPSTVTVAAGSYYWTSNFYISSLITTLQTQLNASRPSGWTVTFDATTGLVTINCSSTPWSITWTSSDLRNLLGFASNIAGVSSAQTGTKQARGLWRPDSPLDLDGDAAMAPYATDLRATRSPRGLVITAVGNRMFRHKGLVWAVVPKNRYRSNQADIDGAAWETFLCDTQISQVSPTGFSVTTLFKPGARVQIFDHTGIKVGQDFGGVGVSGWFMQGLDKLEAKRVSEGWNGLWRVEIPELVSDG